MEFVVKVAKYCNLRCSYCYEYADLHKKERISLEALESFFRNVSCGLEGRYDGVSFCWHGGEPLLIPLSYYNYIGALQREIFKKEITITNTVQTNLTVLTERHIEYFKSYSFFSRVGVSTDVYGDRRVDKRGKQSSHISLANMQRLIEEKIQFSAITVLSRNTLPEIRSIYRFFDQAGIPVRFLPFYLSAANETLAERQVADHSLTHEQLVSAFQAIFDEWFISQNAVPTYPIDEYIDYALAYLGDTKSRIYRLRQVEAVLVVNTDGEVLDASGICAGTSATYGNLFCQDLTEILNSAPRQLNLVKAQERVDKVCGICPYFGPCPGSYVADASPLQQVLLDDCGCPVREVIAHIVRRFEAAQVSELVA